MTDETEVRVLITGGAGFVGRALIRHAPAHAELHATQRRTPVAGALPHPVDLADRPAILRLCERVRPDVVIHTAYSATDGERDIAAATAHIAAACAGTGAALVHLSTDLVFDGETGPYSEQAPPNPIHEYGRWKAEAEVLASRAMPDVAIVRTSLVTCFAPLDPRSAWVAESLRSGSPVILYTDELRCPIAVRDLSLQLWELVQLERAERAGVWHFAGPEATSRYALGLLIAAHQRLDPRGLRAGRSAGAAEPRPRDVRLLTGRADRTLSTRARPVSSLVLDGE